MIRDKQLNVRIPKDLHRRARILCAMTGRPLNEIVEELLLEYLDKQEKLERKKKK